MQARLIRPALFPGLSLALFAVVGLALPRCLFAQFLPQNSSQPAAAAAGQPVARQDVPQRRGSPQVPLSRAELTARFEKFLQTNGRYNDAVHNLLLDYERTLAPDCRSIHLDRTLETEILKPVSYSKKGQAQDGSWKQSFSGTACGQKRLYNIYGTVDDGRISAAYMMPGSSAATFNQQTQVLQQLQDFFREYYHQHPEQQSSTGQCPIEVLDTSLSGAPHPSGAPAKDPSPKDHANESWEEKWDLRLCTRTYTVAIDFASARGATAITIPPGKLQAR